MKDNNLLAEYLEFTIHGYGYNGPGDYEHKGYYKGAGLFCNVNDWNPDSNWNQLMMVAEKIEKEKGINLAAIAMMNRHNNRIAKTNIEAVYNACVEYINQK